LLACDPASTLRGELDAMQASCVVVVIDAAAARHVRAYGYSQETTPHLEQLAAGGVLFERAYSQAPATIVSVPSYLTGLYPHSIATRRREGRAGALLYLPQAFAAAGFRTAGFTQNVVVALALPGDEAFEVFGGHLSGRQGTGPKGPRLVAQALSWVDGIGDDRFFLYVHLLPPHAPYQPPAEHVRFRPPGYVGDLVPDARTVASIDEGRRTISDDDLGFLVSQYDANLRYADALVALLLEGLAERGRLDRTVVVATSDHGEAFGQHGRFSHTSTLYEEMVHVPLVVRLPPGLGAPRRVSETVALLDLAPTLADLFGLGDALARQGAGVSLMDVLESSANVPPERMIFAQNANQVAVWHEDYKLILSSERHSGGDSGEEKIREEIFHLAEDPDERHNLAGGEAGPQMAMRGAVVGFLDGGVSDIGLAAAAETLSAEVRLQLEALGYLLDEQRKRKGGSKRRLPGNE
jgi:arylsulfatase